MRSDRLRRNNVEIPGGHRREAGIVTVIRRRGIFYGDKDARLEVDGIVYFLTAGKVQRYS